MYFICSYRLVLDNASFSTQQQARADPELGPVLMKLEASLSPTGLWDDDLDTLLVFLVAESFVRVRYRERKTALHRSHLCLHSARAAARLLVQLDRKSCACYPSGVGASWTARVDMLPLSVFFMD